MTTRTNLIINPSAEVDTVGTLGFGATVTRTIAEQSVGAAAFEVVTNGGAGFQGFGVQTNTGLGDTGTAQSLIGQLEIKGSGTVNVSVRTWYTDATSTEGPRTLVTTSGTWQQVVTPVAVTSAAKTVDFHQVIARTNVAQTITFYADAVMIEFGTVAGDYFDGDSPDATWTGTPHSSTSILTPRPRIFPILKVGSQQRIGPLRAGKA